MDNYCKNTLLELNLKRNWTIDNYRVVPFTDDMSEATRMTKFEAEETLMRKIGASRMIIGTNKELIADLDKMSLYDINNRDRIIQKMKDDYSMTFVGIAKSKHGIVAFGDSKVTKLNIDDWCLTEVGETQKVFRGNNLLVVTYQNANDSQVFGKRPLADIIGKVLRYHPNITAEKFKKKMERKLKSNKTFYFILGYLDEESREYQIRNLVVNNGIGTFRNNNINVVTNDCPDDCRNAKVFSEEMTVAELRESAKTFVQSVYDYWKDNDYNPIGGHIRVMTLPQADNSFDEISEFR